MMNSRFKAIPNLVRASWVRLKGAHIGAKSRIGKRFNIENASCLTTGQRVTLEDNVSIKIVNGNAKVELANQVFVGRNSIFDISCKLSIGENVLIAPNCFITDHNHGIGVSDRIVDQGIIQSPVVIERDAWIGANACILPGVRIGIGAVIGAGAVVTTDIPDMAVAVGVPAKVARQRD